MELTEILEHLELQGHLLQHSNYLFGQIVETLFFDVISGAPTVSA